ncbi:MAG: hypothetical protein ACYTEZ_15245 [Planctomycetota bacterium]|jgi:uncharacterized membrane protein
MNRTATVGLALVAGMVLLLAAASVLLIDFDRAGWNGAAVGAGVGLVNLALGYWITRRALRRGMRSAMATLLGGFFARLLVVVALVVVFHRTQAVSEVAFALVFMVFFFAYIALEVVLVERTVSRRTA